MPEPYNTDIIPSDVSLEAVSADSLSVSVEADTWEKGMPVETRPIHAGENSWIMSILLLFFVLIAFNIRNLQRILKTFPQDLTGGLKRHTNILEDHTASEKRASGLILLTLCLLEGILLLRIAISQGVLPENSSELISYTLIFIGLAVVYYFGKVSLYMIAGSAFTDGASLAQWRRGYNASQMLLCLLIAVPAIIALLNPSVANTMIIIAIAMFFLCQLLFIIKTVRIFFNNFGSSLYFILYLCALEITPIFIVVAGYDFIISDF